MGADHQSAGRSIDARRQFLAEATISRHWALHPELESRYGPAGRAKCLQDVTYSLQYLADALEAEEPLFLSDYVAWVKVLFAGLHIPAADLAVSLRLMRAVLETELPPEQAAAASAYIDAGLSRLAQAEATIPPLLLGETPLSELARVYLAALLHGERQAAGRLIFDAMERGTDVRDIYLHVFQPCQREVGRLWQTSQISVAQEHYCTAATQVIMAQLYPRIFAGERNGHRMLATCVGGELHEMGIRMVSDFMELDGWDTYYLGANNPAAGILQALSQYKPDVLGISATMTFHVRLVRDLISAVRLAHGERLKIMVGGHPFNIAADLWRQVGADGCAGDAAQAVVAAGQLL